MASLLAPQSYAQDFGTVIARAQQTAIQQSATILSAANNIATQRERAGQAASDAVFRMRLEEFQREQFRQKVKVENARLALDESQAQREQDLHPFNVRSARLRNDLAEVAINDAPLRSALLGAQVTGAALGNQQDALNLSFLPEQLSQRQELGGIQNRVVGSNAELQLNQNDKALDIFDQQSGVIAELNAIASSDSSAASTLRSASALERLRADNGMAIVQDPELTRAFNDAVGRLGVSEKFDALRLSPQAPAPVEGFDIASFQTSTSADGRPSSQAQYQRTGADRKEQLEVQREIRIMREQGEAQAATVQRQWDQVNDEITSLNRDLGRKGIKENIRSRMSSKLEELRSKRSSLERALSGIEAKVAKVINQVISSNSRDSFPGDMPGVSPNGPSTAIIGDPNEFINSIQ